MDSKYIFEIQDAPSLSFLAFLSSVLFRFCEATPNLCISFSREMVHSGFGKPSASRLIPKTKGSTADRMLG
jgi:hypothetical protein